MTKTDKERARVALDFLRDWAYELRKSMNEALGKCDQAEAEDMTLALTSTHRRIKKWSNVYYRNRMIETCARTAFFAIREWFNFPEEVEDEIEIGRK